FQKAGGDAVIEFNLGLASLFTNKKEKALEYLTAAKEKLGNKDRLAPLVYLALARTQPKNAEENLRNALAHDPLLDEARILLALIEWRSGRTKDAEKDMRIFIDGLPGIRSTLVVKNFRAGDMQTTYAAARTEVRTMMTESAKGGVDELLLSVDGML